MRNVRVFSNETVLSDSDLELRGSAARHVSQVLRRKAGDPLTLFDGSGKEYAAVVQGITKGSVLVKVGSRSEPTADSPLDLTLWHGLCRGARMDTVIQKATELGVTRIQPVVTERCVVRLGPDKVDKRVAHWRKIAISACEQSGRNLVPEIHPPASLTDCLAQANPKHCKILLDPAGTDSLAELLTADPIVLFTGPEGGFTDAEAEATLAAGFRGVGIGPRILRTETAPIVALGLVQYLAGDLGGK